jgi:predicted acetyltransferase
MAALATTLLFGTPYDDEFAAHVERYTRNWAAMRMWGYRDAGRWVATLATETRTLTVPGPHGTTRDVETDALTGVSVAATHRRRGLLTNMIAESLRAAKDRGDALAILVAAEWPIYGRFGYAPAVFGSKYTYYPRRLGAALPPPPPGSMRSIEPEQLAEVAPGIFDAARRLRPGQVDRRGPWWDRRLAVDGYQKVGDSSNWLVHEGPDGPDGLIAWHMTRDFELDGHLAAIKVDEFVAASESAYRDLWAYLGALDVIEEIALPNRPVDETVRWLLPNGRALQVTGTFDFVWVRLLDVPAALAARSYAMPGEIVLEVVDDGLGGYGAGRFVLKADETTSVCEPTTEPADLRLSQWALAACYLGGNRLRQLALSGGEELTAGALDRADVMFSVPLAPCNQTGF